MRNYSIYYVEFEIVKILVQGNRRTEVHNARVRP